MRNIAKLASVILLALAAVTTFVPATSASFTCTGGRTTCVVTMTATVRDPSRSGSTDVDVTTAGGLATETCDDSTFSSDASGPDVLRTGSSTIVFTGININFTTNCRINVDTGCTIVATATSGNSNWSLALSSPSGAGPVYSTFFLTGEVRSSLRTCRSAGNNGTLTFANQNLGTSCHRYNSTTGILTLRCNWGYTSSAPNIPSGTAILNGSYHLTVDGAGTSPTVSSA